MVGPDAPSLLRPVLAAGAALAAAGCAALRPISRAQAEAAALRNVCGSPQQATADSTCVVREACRVGDDYRVVVDRRPPAGRDRLAILVRRSGWVGGKRIEVTPLDTAAQPPRR